MEFIVSLNNAELKDAVQRYLDSQSLGLDVAKIEWGTETKDLAHATIQCTKRKPRSIYDEDR